MTEKYELTIRIPKYNEYYRISNPLEAKKVVHGLMIDDKLEIAGIGLLSFTYKTWEIRNGIWYDVLVCNLIRKEVVV